MEIFRQSMKHFVLTFRETPPTMPAISGLLQSFRTDRELTVTVVNPPPDLEARLADLHPESIDPVEMTLEGRLHQLRR